MRTRRSRLRRCSASLTARCSSASASDFFVLPDAARTAASGPGNTRLQTAGAGMQQQHQSACS
jgi:hypothetical protein